MKIHFEGKIVPLLLVALVAIGAGIFAGVKTSSSSATEKNEALVTSNVSQDLKDYSKLQKSLTSSTVFPDDFKSIPDFSLLTGENTAFTEKELSGHWNVLFFGYTHCPDICPVTLNTMNTALAQIAETSLPEPQVVFITVDPVRDTVEKMTQYTQYFNKEFIGVSGDLADITAFTRTLGVVASYTASETDPEQYTVDHTASMLLIDPAGRVRAKFNPPHNSDTISADYISLLAELN